jgi:hypothetical protein
MLLYSAKSRIKESTLEFFHLSSQLWNDDEIVLGVDPSGRTPGSDKTRSDFGKYILCLEKSRYSFTTLPSSDHSPFFDIIPTHHYGPSVLQSRLFRSTAVILSSMEFRLDSSIPEPINLQLKR